MIRQKLTYAASIMHVAAIWIRSLYVVFQLFYIIAQKGYISPADGWGGPSTNTMGNSYQAVKRVRSVIKN